MRIDVLAWGCSTKPLTLESTMFSRSVVQSFGRISLRGLTMLAATAVVGIGSTAFAATEHVQDFVQYDTSESGVLVIDGSNHQTFLPLASTSLSFPTKEDYFAFLYSVLNYAGEEEKSLTIYQAGQLYTYSSDLQSIIPVTDPVATIIGGRHGTVRIGETELCIDPDRCSDPVDPLTLQPTGVYISKTEIFSSAAPSPFSSLSSASTSAISSHHFEIKANLSFSHTITDHDWNKGDLEHAVTTASTTQLSGGFQVLSWKWVPGEERCHDVPTLDGGTTERCHYVAEQFIVKSEGENELTVRFTRQGWIRSAEGWCWYWPEPNPPEKKLTNVEKVEVRDVAKVWTKNLSPYNKFYVRPVSISSTHIGIEPGKHWVMDGLDIDTGFEPDC